MKTATKPQDKLAYTESSELPQIMPAD